MASSSTAFSPTLPLSISNNQSARIALSTWKSAPVKSPTQRRYRHATTHPAVSEPTKAVLSPSTPVSAPRPSPEVPGTPGTPEKKTASSNSKLRLQPTTRDSNWMFYDVARVLVRGGQGGNGIVAFRREKGKPLGGPAGGSGGHGGNVRFIAVAGGNTLSRFRGGTAFRAGHGANGLNKGKHGECASDIVVPVPVGTVVRSDCNLQRVLADLANPGDTFLAARRGRGGRGNASFKTDQNRAPRICEQGQPGVERWVKLELKLVADIGLVGFPNAGKSALLDAVSNARPKIADYPFTTIVPNLGVVDGVAEDADGIVIADVPGLIGGAHKGIGMGLAFLRHVERCKLVVHVIDGSESDIIGRYEAIRSEMNLFDQRLARKKEIILVNKVDLPGVREAWESQWKDQLVTAAGHKRIALVSAKSKEGLETVMRKLRKLIQVTPVEELDLIVEEDDNSADTNPASVECVSPGVFNVAGFKVQQAFDMTNWDYIEGVDRFQRILEALGVNKMLIKAGAKDGDTIQCFTREFVYYKEENIYSAAAALDGYID